MRGCLVAALAALAIQPPLTLERSARGHTSAVRALAFSPDGKTLASCSDDGTIKLWDAPALREVRSLPGHRGAVLCLAFSPDGKRLATGGADKAIRIWDVASGKLLLTRKGHTCAVVGLRFDPKRRFLASAGRDHTIRLWAKRTRVIEARSINCIDLGADGTRVVSGHGDGSVVVWDTASGKKVRTIRSGALHVYGVALHGRFVAVAGKGGGIGAFDLDTGKSIVSHRAGKTGSAVAIRPDGRRLATGLYANIHLWDVRGKREIKTSAAHASWIISVAYRHDGRYLATGDGKGHVKLWRTDAPQSD